MIKFTPCEIDYSKDCKSKRQTARKPANNDLVLLSLKKQDCYNYYIANLMIQTDTKQELKRNKINIPLYKLNNMYRWHSLQFVICYTNKNASNETYNSCLNYIYI